MVSMVSHYCHWWWCHATHHATPVHDPAGHAKMGAHASSCHGSHAPVCPGNTACFHIHTLETRQSWQSSWTALFLHVNYMSMWLHRNKKPACLNQTILCNLQHEAALLDLRGISYRCYSIPSYSDSFNPRIQKKKPLRSAKTIPPQVRHASCAGVMATKSSWSGTIAPEAKKVCCAVKLYLNARFMLGIAVSAS